MTKNPAPILCLFLCGILSLMSAAAVLAASSDKPLIVSVKEARFGARGDGKTDDTQAIQKAVDRVFAQGGGKILFPPGTYIVTSVNIREGITYEGYGATIKRPDHLTEKIGRKAARWVRTFTNQKHPYAGEKDSPPLIIRGLTFDGSSQTQGSYQKWELEQAALVFLMGDKKKPGRLTAIVEDCTFRNGVGDGVHAYVNTHLKMINCTAENVFRGGFVLTGGHSVAEVRNLVTRGKIDPTGIDVEVDGAGYGGSYRVEVYLEDLRLEDGDFDVGVRDGSLVVGKNIVAEAPFNLYTRNSTARFSHCTFGVLGGNRIIFPRDVVFTNCKFYASGKKATNPAKFVSAAPLVAWNLSGTYDKNQRLTFKHCSFTMADRPANSEGPVYGVYTGWDAVDFNNVLTLEGCTVTLATGIGLAMMYRGGNWVVTDTVFDTDLALSFTGFPDPLPGDSWFNIRLEGITIRRGRYAHIGGYGPNVEGQTNQNRLEQRRIIIDEANNYLSSEYGLEGNRYVGHRVIMGENPPSPATHGLVGDIYKHKGSDAAWRCIKNGYVLKHQGKETQVPSQWAPAIGN